MKNKKIIIPVIIAVFVLIIVFIKMSNNSNTEIVKIEYSYNTGFGTIVDTSNKTISFTPNGKVKLTNEYNSYKESFDIDIAKYTELNDYIVKRISMFDKKINEEKDVLDGSSSNIIIVLKDGTKKSVGGYMVNNKEYREIVDKIFEIVGNERIEQYLNNLEINE